MEVNLILYLGTERYHLHDLLTFLIICPIKKALKIKYTRNYAELVNGTLCGFVP